MKEIKVNLTGYLVVKADSRTLERAQAGELDEFPYEAQIIGLYQNLEQALKLGFPKGGNLCFLLKGQTAELVGVWTLKEKTILPVEDGTIEHLNFNEHRRAKNWIAKVRKNQAKPNGLEREFITLVRGGQRALVIDKASGQLLIKEGDCLEFGGDYYTASGNRKPSRRYYRVIRVENGEVELEEISKESI